MRSLAGSIRHYDWGSTTALARFRGVEDSGLPEAELWFDDPPGLPFLVKLLAVGRPLSLQAHPGVEAAKAGFAKEEAAGIARDDPERSFPDDRAKPELVCALGAFEALCGFRAVEEALEVAAAVGVPAEIMAPLLERGSSGWPELFRAALRNDRIGAVEALLRRCVAGVSGVWSETAALVVRLAERYSDDPALLVVPLLRHHHLEAGDALFVKAGVPHSYLKGMAVEVMPRSDNVCRGGLTSKHVDILGFADVLELIAPLAVVQKADSPVHVYDGPAEGIRVMHICDTSLLLEDFEGPHLVLGAAGSAVVQAEREVVLGPGEALEIPDQIDSYSVTVTGEVYVIGEDQSLHNRRIGSVVGKQRSSLDHT